MLTLNSRREQIGGAGRRVRSVGPRFLCVVMAGCKFIFVSRSLPGKHEKTQSVKEFCLQLTYVIYTPFPSQLVKLSVLDSEASCKSVHQYGRSPVLCRIIP